MTIPSMTIPHMGKNFLGPWHNAGVYYTILNIAYYQYQIL